MSSAVALFEAKNKWQWDWQLHSMLQSGWCHIMLSFREKLTPCYAPFYQNSSTACYYFCCYYYDYYYYCYCTLNCL